MRGRLIKKKAESAAEKAREFCDKGSDLIGSGAATAAAAAIAAAALTTFYPRADLVVVPASALAACGDVGCALLKWAALGAHMAS